MGKCLSCCEQLDQPVQICHPHNRSTTKSSEVSSTIPPESKPLPYYSGGDTTQHKMQTNINKKALTQYPGITPMKKPSTCNPESKRTSLTNRDISESRISAMFDQYCDTGDDCILAEGIEKLCYDLEVRPEEFKVLVLAWKFQADTMCCFTRSEFTNGCKMLKVDSIKGIRSKFPEILVEVQNKQTFKDLYRWTYKFGLDKETGQRTLPVDMAISLWTIIFSAHSCPPPILKRWLSFLEKHPSIRGIPHDTWDMFLNFADQVSNDLSSYDDTEAWPSLFDDFVEYENDRENQNVQMDKEKPNEC